MKIVGYAKTKEGLQAFNGEADTLEDIESARLWVAYETKSHRTFVLIDCTQFKEGDDDVACA